ncbi:MAG: RNA exonuclease 3 [Piccolia ochrophora]|nr:MAG: RNA exonuclease 3 [Piccolia ochrophora]
MADDNDAFTSKTAHFVIASVIIGLIMFSSLKLFSRIRCPDEGACLLPACIFSHAPRDQSGEEDTLTSHDASDGNATSSRKRRKLVTVGREAKSPSISSQTSYKLEPAPKDANTSLPRTKSDLVSARKSISPPPLRTAKDAVQKRRNPEDRFGRRTREAADGKAPISATHVVEETLNPRFLAKPPASHAVRLAILQKLHEQLVRLNNESTKIGDQASTSKRSEQDLIKMALDEEEKVARTESTLYSNVIKNRIMVFKKMKLEAWREMLAEAEARRTHATVKERAKSLPPIDTGLTAAEELALLPRLQAPSAGLDKCGYVFTQPTDADIEEARKGVEASSGWEVCDRCTMRFQVFPGRREEDGALTSGGACKYHYGKPIFPSRDRNDRTKERPAKLYSCCNEPVGTTSGCTTHTTHVFKVSEVKRLASILQFEPTPPNPDVPTDRAVCLDCEMGYTTNGLELIRLTATAWPSGAEMLDVLVRPLGEILDLNTRFSGVTAHHLATADAYSSSSPPQATTTTTPSPLPIVPSPTAARALLFTHLSPTTPLLGHALENDLSASRIVHAALVDTALLFPHRFGLPYRNSLKMLMSRYLERDIQVVQSGALGHDSKEDARAAGDLVRWAVGREWARLRREGWTVEGGVFSPPVVEERRARVRKRGSAQVDGEDEAEGRQGLEKGP